MGRAQATKVSSDVGVGDAIEALRNVAREKMDDIDRRTREALHEQGIDFRYSSLSQVPIEPYF
jgi:hypothetical protein